MAEDYADKEEKEEDDFEKEIGKGNTDEGITKYVNDLIKKAHKDRATDIHFEPQEDELQIRNRVDGILHKIALPPSLWNLQDMIISRIKIMSDMNIAEKRMPQDGRINRTIEGKQIDIRVSTVPTRYGESVSIFDTKTSNNDYFPFKQRSLGYGPQGTKDSTGMFGRKTSNWNQCEQKFTKQILFL